MGVMKMKRKEIHFSINPSGGITITVKGVKGASCKDIVEEFKKLGKVVQEIRTGDFFERGEVKNVVRSTMGKR
jgi:hypothetical protein